MWTATCLSHGSPRYAITGSHILGTWSPTYSARGHPGTLSVEPRVVLRGPPQTRGGTPSFRGVDSAGLPHILRWTATILIGCPRNFMGFHEVFGCPHYCVESHAKSWSPIFCVGVQDDAVLGVHRLYCGRSGVLAGCPHDEIGHPQGFVGIQIFAWTLTCC